MMGDDVVGSDGWGLRGYAEPSARKRDALAQRPFARDMRAANSARAKRRGCWFGSGGSARSKWHGRNGNAGQGNEAGSGGSRCHCLGSEWKTREEGEGFLSGCYAALVICHRSLTNRFPGSGAGVWVK